MMKNIKKYKNFINESYSKDNNDLINFLNSLNFDIDINNSDDNRFYMILKDSNQTNDKNSGKLVDVIIDAQGNVNFFEMRIIVDNYEEDIFNIENVTLNDYLLIEKKLQEWKDEYYL